MKNIIITALGILYFGTLQGQDQGALRLHYRAYNYFHPGLEIGYEKPLLSIQKMTKKDRTKWYQLYLAPNLGFYNQKRSHSGISLGADLGIKTIGGTGLELELFGGTHYLRAQLANPTFEQQPNGSFEQLKGAGNNHFQWRAGLGVGKLFQGAAKNPFSVNLKAGVSQPHFPGSPVVPNLWLGVNWYL